MSRAGPNLTQRFSATHPVNPLAGHKGVRTGIYTAQPGAMLLTVIAVPVLLSHPGRGQIWVKSLGSYAPHALGYVIWGKFLNLSVPQNLPQHKVTGCL